jgi:hypothetical protein
MPTLDFTSDELAEWPLALRAAAYRATQDAAES